MIFKKNSNREGRSGSGRASDVPTLIAAETEVHGSLASAGEIQVDGIINGDIRAASVVVGRQGLVQGEVVAEEAVVMGRIIGPIFAVNVTLLAGAQVDGDVVNSTLAIETGAQLDGKLRRSEDPLGEHASLYGYTLEQSYQDQPEAGGYETYLPPPSNDYLSYRPQDDAATPEEAADNEPPEAGTSEQRSKAAE